ncbi:ANTAR domain-containing protein [Knoellia sp. CPCC 206450]|uniref:ANTAR domain-containing protein n=1 Tax=Knoellia tibetensis TaxID=3404798 RepID=UPI003B4327B5
MDEDPPVGVPELQGQIDDLRSRVDASDKRALALESRADKAELWADDSTTRADAAERRADLGSRRSEDDHRRLADVEGRLDVHDEIIAELQAEGLISSKQAKNLEGALQTARTIGAAVGIVMTHHRLSEAQAFELLRKASMDANSKLRLVAEDVVLTGAVPGLPPRQ